MVTCFSFVSFVSSFHFSYPTLTPNSELFWNVLLPSNRLLHGIVHFTWWKLILTFQSLFSVLTWIYWCHLTKTILFLHAVRKKNHTLVYLLSTIQWHLKCLQLNSHFLHVANIQLHILSSRICNYLHLLAELNNYILYDFLLFKRNTHTYIHLGKLEEWNKVEKKRINNPLIIDGP